MYLFSMSISFCVIIRFLARLLVLGIAFLTAVNAAVAATKLVIVGILPSVTLIFAFQSVSLTSPLISDIFLSESLVFFSSLDLSVP